jgi:hypothetical protein
MRRSSAAARSTTAGVDGDSSGRPRCAEVIVTWVEVLVGVRVPFGAELVLAGLAGAEVLIGAEAPFGVGLVLAGLAATEVLAGLAVYGGADLTLAGLAGVELLAGADVPRDAELVLARLAAIEVLRGADVLVLLGARETLGNAFPGGRSSLDGTELLVAGLGLRAPER